MGRISKYGYKVGYYENGSRLFVCHFKDRTYSEAIRSLEYFKSHPIKSHQSQQLLKNPIWTIKPIRFSEVAKGIWRECPF